MTTYQTCNIQDLLYFIETCQRPDDKTSTKFEQSIRAMRELALEIGGSLPELRKELHNIPLHIKETITAYLLGHPISIPFGRGTLPSKYAIPLYHSNPVFSKENIVFLHSRVVIEDMTDLWVFPNGPAAITCLKALQAGILNAWEPRVIPPDLDVPLPRLLLNSPGYSPKYGRLEMFDAVNLCYKLGDTTYARFID